MCIVDSQLDLNILETHLQSAELQINPNLLGQIGLDLAGVCWTMRDLSLQQHRLEHCDEADVGSEGVCGSQQSTPCYGFLGLWKPAGELCAGKAEQQAAPVCEQAAAAEGALPSTSKHLLSAQRHGITYCVSGFE